MASAEAIIATWKLIEAAGYPRLTSEAGLEEQLDAWTALLADVADERLAALTVAWLRSPDSRFARGRWPVPADIIHALGDASAVDDADEAWSQALVILRLGAADRLPTTVDDLERVRNNIRDAYAKAREAGDAEKTQRYLRLGTSLPPENANRNAAILAGVAACGGWRALGRSEEGDVAAHRASFRGAYRSAMTRQRLTRTEEAVAGLLGDGPSLRMLPGGRSDAPPSPPARRSSP